MCRVGILGQAHGSAADDCLWWVEHSWGSAAAPGGRSLGLPDGYSSTLLTVDTQGMWVQKLRPTILHLGGHAMN